MKHLKKKFYAMLNKGQIFSLINLANIESGLLTRNAIRSADEFIAFSDIRKGIPILTPADPSLFNFNRSDIFKISPLNLLEIIYGHSDQSYVGYKHAFPQYEFLSNFKVKSKYRSFIEKIKKQNLLAQVYIDNLKRKINTIGSFQTRNIPHFGHEKIIEKMLEFCDHVVINPVIGPKKIGDVSVEALNTIYDYLTKEKFKNKISFMPVYANMYYAGPREAIHHTIIREKLGFDYFTVGRDHAGADRAYNSTLAPSIITKYQSTFKINVIAHYGVAFCPQCKDFVFSGKCNHKVEKLIDISGSEFRSTISLGQIFKFADKNLQEYIIRNNLEIFEK